MPQLLNDEQYNLRVGINADNCSSEQYNLQGTLKARGANRVWWWRPRVLAKMSGLTWRSFGQRALDGMLNSTKDAQVPPQVCAWYEWENHRFTLIMCSVCVPDSWGRVTNETRKIHWTVEMLLSKILHLNQMLPSKRIQQRYQNTWAAPWWWSGFWGYWGE